MVRKFGFVIVLGLGLAGNVVLADYQSGFSLRQNNVHTDAYDYSVSGLSGFYYLERIRTRGVPQGEAAFLQRVPRIDASLETSSYTSDINDDRESDSYSLAYSHVSHASPLTYSVEWLNSDTTYTSNLGPATGDVNYRSYELSVGYFLGRTTHVDVSYQREDFTVDNVIVEYSYSDTYGLSGKHVFLINHESALSLTGNYSITQYSTDQSSDIVGVGFDYYINRNFSLGGDFEVTGGDRKAFNGTSMVLRAISFVSPRVSIGVEYIKFTAEDVTGEDLEETRLVSDVRF